MICFFVHPHPRRRCHRQRVVESRRRLFTPRCIVEAVASRVRQPTSGSVGRESGSRSDSGCGVPRAENAFNLSRSSKRVHTASYMAPRSSLKQFGPRLVLGLELVEDEKPYPVGPNRVAHFRGGGSIRRPVRSDGVRVDCGRASSQERIMGSAVWVAVLRVLLRDFVYAEWRCA